MRRRIALAWASVALAVAAASTVQAVPSARVWAVDPSGTAGGSGELASPFARLSTAAERSAPGDWIVVLSGELAESIELKAGQHLVGPGTTIGLPDGRTLPAAEPPRIGDGTGPGVVLASGCTVRGLVVRGSPGVLGRNVHSVTLADLQVRGSTTDGVLLHGAGGTVTLEKVSVAGSGGHGLAVSAGGDAPLDLRVHDCELVDNRSAGIDIRYTGTGGSVSFNSNQIDGNASGVVLTHATPDGSVRAAVTGNRFNLRRGGSHTALQLFLAAQSTASSTLYATVAGNQIGSRDLPSSGSVHGNGIEVYASGGGHLAATVTDNHVRAIGNGSALRAVSSSHSGRLDLTARGNRLTTTPSGGSPLAGLEFVAGTTPKDSGTLCADIRGNLELTGEAAGASVTTVAGSPTVELVGYRGSPDQQTAVEAFLDGAAETVNPSASGMSSLAAGTVRGRATPCPAPS
jgi:hypothetical protein